MNLCKKNPFRDLFVKLKADKCQCSIEVIQHIGPDCWLFAVKSTSAETGMGVTSRP